MRDFVRFENEKHACSRCGEIVDGWSIMITYEGKICEKCYLGMINFMRTSNNEKPKEE